MKTLHWKYLLTIALACIGASNVFAENRIINLEVGYKNVNFAGKEIQAMAINNQIPAPTLHFKEGDHITINVTNYLDKGTTIHWHGLLIPWQMDGVEGISQKAISPDGVFSYQFTLKQSGTYWYHAHAGFQEQQGLYGAIIIEPIKPSPYRYTKDYVIVLSDWSNTAPPKIFANLKKKGDYYSSQFPTQPSLKKFMDDYRRSTPEQRENLINHYKMMQDMRMSIYDFSDVAYDAFLLNGQSSNSPWTAPVKVGDIVRLRFIGAGGSTNFRVKIADTKMKVIHVEGNDVKPYSVDELTITPGETYDVLIKIQKDSPYIIYAESADTVGAAMGALITHPEQKVSYKQVKPFLPPLPVTMDHPMAMGDKQISSHVETTNTKYQDLTALVKTNDSNKPIYQTIKMDLFGFMDRYIWFINGVPEYKAKPILIDPGKRYRIIFTNQSMMHHPMHIHGHWFILRNNHGTHDPLLHTIDVSPGATVVADFDTDASGQWFFHCHHLYHMMAGMARVLQYKSIIDIVNGKAKPQNEIFGQSYPNQPIVRVDTKIPIDTSLITHPMGHPPRTYMANFFDIGQNLIHNSQQISFKGLYGKDYHKIEIYTDDAEVKKGKIENADIDIFYWHLIDQFWAIKGGANYFYRPTEKPYWQPGIGIEGFMPYFIDTNVRAYCHSGATKLNVELSRDSQLLNNFLIRTGIRSILSSKTVVADEVGKGLNQMRYTIRPYYRLLPALTVFAEFEHNQTYGALKKLHRSEGKPARASTLTFGFSILF